MQALTHGMHAALPMYIGTLTQLSEYKTTGWRRHQQNRQMCIKSFYHLARQVWYVYRDETRYIITAIMDIRAKVKGNMRLKILYLDKLNYTHTHT